MKILTIFPLLFILIITNKDKRHNSEPKFELISISVTYNDTKGILEETIISIDREGNVEYNGHEKYLKIDNMKTINSSFSKMLLDEKFSKTVANNDPPLEYVVPKTPGKILNVFLIKLDDAHNDKKYFNVTSYEMKQNLTLDSNDYFIYKYLNPVDLELFQNLLK